MQQLQCRHVFSDESLPLCKNKDQIIIDICDKLRAYINSPNPHIYRKRTWEFKYVSLTAINSVCKFDILNAFNTCDICISNINVSTLMHNKYDYVNYWGGPGGIFFLPLILLANAVIYTCVKNPIVNSPRFVHSIIFDCQTVHPCE
jgi:hypothetical protein